MPFSRILLAGTFLIGFAGSALALDGNDFAKTLTAAYAGSGSKLQYSGVDANGETVVMHNAVVVAPGDEKFTLGDVTFSGVEESDGGGYTAESATVPDIVSKHHRGDLSIKNIKVNGIDIPPMKPSEGTAQSIIYQSASAGPVTLSDKEGEVFSATSLTSKIDRMDNDAGYKADVQANGLTFHLDRVRNPKTKAAVEAMGYQTVTGKFDMTGSWKADHGEVQVADCTLDLDNVGKLDLRLDLSGYTPDFIKSLRQLQAQALSKPGDKGAQQALGIGMLGLLQQLSFGGLSLRFDDASLTHKALTYAGQQQGVSADQMAQVAKAMLPIGLAKLKNPQFQQEISDAVGKFLDNPKNLEINAAPDKPVAFPMIMGSAMAAPQSLPNVLNVKVTANQ